MIGWGSPEARHPPTQSPQPPLREFLSSFPWKQSLKQGEEGRLLIWEVVPGSADRDMEALTGTWKRPIRAGASEQLPWGQLELDAAEGPWEPGVAYARGYPTEGVRGLEYGYLTS